MTNDVNYFEIGSPDPEASKAFYGALFDWNVGEPSMPARYSMINEDRGGLWDTSEMGAASWAIFYVQVEDVPTAIDRAHQPAPPWSYRSFNNRAIEFAHLTDPLGNRFGIWRPKAAQ